MIRTVTIVARLNLMQLYNHIIQKLLIRSRVRSFMGLGLGLHPRKRRANRRESLGFRVQRSIAKQVFYLTQNT